MESKTKNIVIVIIILLTVAGVVLGLVFGLKGKGKSGGGGVGPSPYPPAPAPTPPAPTPPAPTPPAPTPIPPDCSGVVKTGTKAGTPGSGTADGEGNCVCNDGYYCIDSTSQLSNTKCKMTDPGDPGNAQCNKIRTKICARSPGNEGPSLAPVS